MSVEAHEAASVGCGERSSQCRVGDLQRERILLRIAGGVDTQVTALGLVDTDFITTFGDRYGYTPVHHRTTNFVPLVVDVDQVDVRDRLIPRVTVGLHVGHCRKVDG